MKPMPKFLLILIFQCKMSGFDDPMSFGLMNMQSISQEGNRSYLNLDSPLNMSKPSGSNMNEQNTIQPTPSFMKVFDVNLVGKNPQEIPDGFIKGKHPEWLYVYGTYQFVEPQGSTNSNKSIAFWDQYYNRPFFYGKGYLFRDPKTLGNYDWSFDPESQLFQNIEKKGMYVLLKWVFYHKSRFMIILNTSAQYFLR